MAQWQARRQVASTAQFLDWFKKPFPGQNVFELYRRHAEAAAQRRVKCQVEIAPGSAPMGCMVSLITLKLIIEMSGSEP
jgi:hypothetical protein